MSLISVIVPVYNVEPYLEACLDSLLASTHKDLEIILVDDGSPDRCPEICDTYAAKEPRIKLIHQENMGLIAARNAGMAQATGEYLTFIDSDDMVSPVMYERMLSVMEQTGADMACCEFVTSLENLLLECGTPAVPTACLETYDDQLAVLITAPSIRGVTWSCSYVWNKLYRRELLTFPFRDGLPIGEDLQFNWEYIQNCRSMAILPEKLYFYRRNPRSIMATYNSGACSDTVVRYGGAFIDLWDHLEKNSPVRDEQLRRYMDARAAYMAHGGLWRICAAGQEDRFKEQATKARRLIRDHVWKVWRDKETYNRKVSAVMFLCRYCFPLWVLAARISGRRS